MKSWTGPRPTAQQLQQLTPQQRLALQQQLQARANGAALPQQQLLQQQVRQKLGSYHFATTSAEILRKYAKYPPLLTFHIYDTHFRFNNTPDLSIVPKNSPMVRSFMEHVVREEIPTEMLELLKDFSIRFYDGCLVLQVYDHRRQTVPTGTTTATTAAGDTPNGATEAANGTNGANGTSETEKGDKNRAAAEAEKAIPPKTYRTLLRPTPLSLYYDLLYHTDSALTKFTDQLSLQMEAEILTLTNRKVDLTVPLNPYLQDQYLHPESEYPKRVWDEASDDLKVVHSHLDESAREQRRLREDQLVIHRTSEYEELMCLLSNNYKTPSDASTGKRLVVAGPSAATSSDPVSLESTPFALSLAPEKAKRTEKPSAISAAASVLAGNATSNQFMRLRFIEEIRKRKLTQKAQAGAAMAAQALAQTLAAPVRPEATMTAQRQQHLKQQALAKIILAQMQQQSPQQQTPSLQHLPQHLLPPQLQMGQVPVPHIPLHQRSGQPMGQSGSASQQRPVQNFGGQQMPNMGRNPGMGQPLQQLQQLQQQHQMTKQAQLMRAQQMQIQQARQQQMRQQQQHQQQQPLQQAILGQITNQMQNQMPVAKRAKMMGTMNQMQLQSPQYPGSHSPLIGNSQPGSGMSTPVVPAGNMVTPQMGAGGLSWQQMGQMSLPGHSTGQTMNMNVAGVGNVGNVGSVGNVVNVATGQNVGSVGNVGNVSTGQNLPRVAQRPSTQPAAGTSSAQPLQQQQQQQQIFQMSLSPQEQHTFRQLQARMNALVQMSNTGVAPNRGRLTPQQQQQAMQQAKHIQQQLLQRFPTYFQRLRQFQLVQQQRRQAIQRQQQPQSQQQPQPTQTQTQTGDIGGMDNSMYQNMGMNMSLPMMQQQMMGLSMMQQQQQQQRSGNGKQ